MFPPIRMDEERDAEGDDDQAGPRLLPQAHELPDAHPDLQGARAQLPRPADAPGRERHRLPQRALRRAARPDPRARIHPGRLAPVRHARAARGRSARVLEFVISMLRDFGLDDFELELSMRDDEKSKWIGTDGVLGVLDQRPAQRRARERAQAHRGARRGRVLRSEDRPEDEGCDRPHLAALDRAGRPQPARALRPRVHRTGRRRSTARS